jgi:hypothetical protein
MVCKPSVYPLHAACSNFCTDVAGCVHCGGWVANMVMGGVGVAGTAGEAGPETKREHVGSG